MIFEWKTYQASDGAASAMKDRFMKHTLPLLAKHNIGVVNVFSDPNDASVLYYLTQFQDDDARQAAWKSFQADPVWQEVKRNSESKGPLVASHTTIVLRSDLPTG
jgi:hypothetical protein